MSPKVPQAYLDARRAEIIDAAFKCFMEKGFHNTTMQDIYDATKLSPGAVYNYFHGKEDIVVAAVKEFSVQSLVPLKSLISENPEESFIKYFQFLFSTIKQNDMTKSFSVQQEIYSEATRNRKIHEAVIKSMNAIGVALVGPVKRKQHAGFFNAKLDPVSIAHVMAGMVWAGAVHKMLEPDFDMENFGKVCEAMLTGTFATAPVKQPKTNKAKPKRKTGEKGSGGKPM
jgi:TetR/AcrR family transcriptional regulator, transcriptional repressor of aconitase